MAAPTGFSLKDMTGDWVTHKGLSDDYDPVLALEGVPWWKRQAAGIITVTERITHTKDDKDTHKIVIEKRMTGGFKAEDEVLVTDGSIQSLSHSVFGNVKVRSEWSDLSEVDDKWLKEDWNHGSGENDGVNDAQHIKVSVSNDQLGWDLTVVWGFVLIDGKYYHSRRMLCRKGDQVAKAQIIFAWSRRG
ncbi:hypothetical protein CC78DRAFT_454848 [Lojkania enalia]|uniref:Lccl domain-containing protein n=1 Tax=Lojkania enalia TaxID=147567 RepID=A0A9P4N6N8_9PLEO|nr:hypothetical protein CC78DRAFT_454848 [Didymosphaeria enalia]